MSPLNQQTLRTLNTQALETAEPAMDAELVIDITPVEPNLNSSSDVAPVFPCR